MTQCIIIGEDKKAGVKVKVIEFKEAVYSEIRDPYISSAGCHPNRYDHIELVRKGNSKFYDIMFAYMNDRSDGILYLGHWNEGVVG